MHTSSCFVKSFCPPHQCWAGCVIHSYIRSLHERFDLLCKQVKLKAFICEMSQSCPFILPTLLNYSAMKSNLTKEVLRYCLLKQSLNVLYNTLDSQASPVRQYISRSCKPLGCGGMQKGIAAQEILCSPLSLDQCCNECPPRRAKLVK